MNVILCHGLLQPKHISNGLETLRQRLKYALGARLDELPYYGWTDSLKVIERVTDLVETPLVLIGHSWGVWWLTQLASELLKCDKSVTCLFSCDGVNRPLRSPLSIPPNVENLFMWRQSQSRIKGSDIQFSDSTVRQYSMEVVGTPHAKMDELQDFQDIVVTEVERILS